ncbi:MAG: ferrous iron transport protein B [Planctomycetes bacterium]|nr:ferrous iron transport protein B [Planctomycetota bacterium]
MHTLPPGQTVDAAARHRLIALVGNPNTGKTTLFNALTGYRQHVGNYPGATVEKKIGKLRWPGGPPVEVVDLPGTYSLSARSVDEAVVADVLFGHQKGVGPIALIVAVLDATNLHRHLFLTSQLFEVGVPVVLALNMMDLARSDGIKIDATLLSQRLGVPVIGVTANKGQGLDELKRCIAATLDGEPPGNHPEMPEALQAEARAFGQALNDRRPSANNGLPRSRLEWMHLLLDQNGYAEQRLHQMLGPSVARDLDERRGRLTEAGVVLPAIEGQSRYRWIDSVLGGVLRETTARVRTRSDAVDRVLTHRLFGLAIFLGMLGIVFQALYSWAAPLMDLVEGAFAAGGQWAARLLPDGALQSLLVDGVVAGMGGVLIFLPQIMILFLFIAVLEDCGYLARGAFLMDRWLRVFGLSGKSFIPLLSSFACAIPGIMAARTIENRSDRLVTIFVAPLMSCSARLPVYVLLIAAFVPSTTFAGGMIGLQGAVLLGMYLLGLVVAIPVALLTQRLIGHGEERCFLIELPSYKWPSPRNVLFRVYASGKEFVVRAGTIILATSIVVWALGYYPRTASVAAEYDIQRADTRARLTGDELDESLAALDRAQAGAYLRQSALARLGRVLEPAVKPLGWDWKIGTAVLASFPAREVVIATMGTIYNLGDETDEESSGLRSALRAATWPDGRKVYTLPVALSIMVFFALCCQCVSTLAIMRKETNSWRWPVMAFSYMTALGYVGAWATYRVAGWMV